MITARGNAFTIVAEIMLICCCFLSNGEQELQINDVRFFFNPRPPVKPTAAITHHEPGLPPGWTRPSTPPTRPPSAINSRLHTEGTPSRQTQEFSVESQVIEISSTPANNGISQQSSDPVRDENNGLPPGVHPPMAITDASSPNKNVFDWIFGLFGRPTTTAKPTQPPTSQPHVNPSKCKGCTCGIGYKFNRIVGGHQTVANAYTWMVYLTYSGRFYCGASVINDRYLLTAAHCVNGFAKDRLLATFLDHDRAIVYETKTFTRKITSVLRHNGYGAGGSFNNDIALLKLNEPLDFSGLVKPVCLPPTGRSFTGFSAIVTGWGATEAAGQVSSVLREVTVPIMSNKDCQKTGYGRRITDNMVCAGYPEGMKDSCQGDSGGPMHIINGSSYTIVGIVSWGEGCAQANYPGVYTRVNRYKTWILSNTRDACYC